MDRNKRPGTGCRTARKSTAQPCRVRSRPAGHWSQTCEERCTEFRVFAQPGKPHLLKPREEAGRTPVERNRDSERARAVWAHRSVSQRRKKRGQAHHLLTQADSVEQSGGQLWPTAGPTSRQSVRPDLLPHCRYPRMGSKKAELVPSRLLYQLTTIPGTDLGLLPERHAWVRPFASCRLKLMW
jgi:hypothetical protein